MDFLYPLRVMAGRQLSPLGIRRANRDWHRESVIGGKSYTRSGDELFLSETIHGTYPDSSLEVRRYTSDGKLKSVSITGVTGDNNVFNYDPPGRFVGKKVVPEKAAA